MSCRDSAGLPQPKAGDVLVERDSTTLALADCGGKKRTIAALIVKCDALIVKCDHRLWS